MLVLLLLLMMLDLLKSLLLSYALVWDWLWDNTHGDCLRRCHSKLRLLSRIGRRRAPHRIVGQELMMSLSLGMSMSPGQELSPTLGMCSLNSPRLELGLGHVVLLLQLLLLLLLLVVVV